MKISNKNFTKNLIKLQKKKKNSKNILIKTKNKK